MKTIEFPKSYVVWDLETDGLDPKTCHILEIGALLINDGKVTAEYNWILNHGVQIPPEITKINGITQEMVDKGMDPELALKQFLKTIGWGKSEHVTHNGIRFDIPFLLKNVELICKDLTFVHVENLERELFANSIDTAVIMKAKKLNMYRKWNESFKQWADRVMAIFAKGVKYNVSICCDELGIDKSNSTLHRAGGDCGLTNEIYKKLVL